MGIDVIGALVLTIFAFYGMAVNFRFASSNYPKFHKNNPLVSQNGFNIAFIDFTDESWAYTRKLGFKLFLVVGSAHVLICALCLLLFPILDKMLVIMGSFTFFALASLAYLLHKITRYKE